MTAKIVIKDGGGLIDKQSIPELSLEKLKTDLSFPNPRHRHDMRMRGKSKRPPTFDAWSETDSHFWVPFGSIHRIVAVCHGLRKKVEMDDQTDRYDIPFRFSGRLEGWQYAALNKIAQHRYGILIAPPGTGKQKVVSALLEERRYPTLIVVKTVRELHLWVEHLESNGISESRIGRIGDRHHTLDKPITVAIDRSLWRHLGDPTIRIGQVIIPKADSANPKIFRKTVGESNARYVLGLCDAPRNDGLSGLMAAFCGPVLYQVTGSESAQSRGGGGEVWPVKTGWKYAYQDDFQQMISEMVSSHSRNATILTDLCYQLASEDVRAVAVSDRLDHLSTIQNLLSDQTLPSGRISSMTHPDDERRMIKGFNTGRLKLLLVSSRSLNALSKARKINRLFILTPISGGQILALLLSFLGSDSVIYEYIDEPELLINSYRRRLKFYRERGFKEIS